MRLSNRIGTWWMNPRLSDVKFNVGPPDGVQELIPAHIVVVAPASEVFSAMFLGGFDVPATIDVPDGDPDAFKEMLRFIYTDRAAVTVGNASGLLYLAKKYLMSGLTDLVVRYLWTKIGKVNFSVIYREAVLHEEMRGVWADFIAQYPNDIFLSDDFVELDFDEMRKVALKSLAIDTLTFYRKMLAWAQDECQRRTIDSSATNMRCVLADAFKLIRFVELNPGEFEQGPGCDELLTVH
ncbi:BTB/POZ domain containing protein, partial [Aphelenchoides avenae]